MASQTSVSTAKPELLTLGHLALGHLAGAYGVKGWIRVHSDTRPIENILSYEPWYLELNNGWEPRRVIDGRRQGKGLVVRLEGCDDREQAAALRSTRIGIQAEQLPALASDEYYWRDLIGLQVSTRDGVVLGTVDHLMETGNNDVLVVTGERERLIPYLPDSVVLEINPAEGRMVVDWDPEF